MAVMLPSGGKFDLKMAKKPKQHLWMCPAPLKFFVCHWLSHMLLKLIPSNDSTCFMFSGGILGKLEGKICQKMNKKLLIFWRNHPNYPSM